MPTEQIIQALQRQLSERLEKLWRIFQWSSNNMIAIIAVTIALGKINISRCPYQ